MPSESPDRLEQLFQAALAQPPEARAAFLDRACDDADLRFEVESLLAADAEADDDDFLADLPVETTDELDGEPEPAGPNLTGQTVGPYTVERLLGSGGMGDVYLAVRKAPFHQTVALKVLRQNVGRHEMRRRFTVERQILASLDHEGIAHLLDGGVTDDGLPYFAMEVVHGETITAYCDTHRLSIPDRLRLFIRVCEAVHYAHQNLVVHRDLKPSNILVADGDGSASVKLLDFGVAKLLSPEEFPVMPVQTRTLDRMLTPEYAAPEQVRGEPITTATDVYALGVVLYELLAGSRPYRITSYSSAELERVICDGPVEPPSTRAVRDEPVENGEIAVATVAERSTERGTTPDRLQRTLRGDLDSVVLKALRKEPQARYASAEQLAADINRYLEGLPVEARRASRWYRARAFVRRHRVGSAAAAAAILALTVGLALAVWQARIAAAERDRAEHVATFMEDLLGEFDPYQAGTGSQDADGIFEQAVQRVESGLSEQPAIQAKLYSRIGRIYQTRAQYEVAERLLRRAVALQRDIHGDEHLAVAESLNQLAWIRAVQNETTEADSLYQEAYAILERIGERESVVAATSLEGRGVAHRVMGKTDKAIELIREAVVIREDLLGPDHLDTNVALNTLASTLYYARRYDEAAPLFERLTTDFRRTLGTHLHTAQTLNDYASLLIQLDENEKAVEMHREALAIRRDIFGESHPHVAQSLAGLGWALQLLDRHDEAESLYRESLEIRRTYFGENSTTVARSLQLIAGAAFERGETEDALRLQTQAVRTFEAELGADSRTTLFGQYHRARYLHALGRMSEARILLVRVVPALFDKLGADSPSARRAQALLAEIEASV